METEVISEQEAANPKLRSISTTKRSSNYAPVLAVGPSMPYEEYSQLMTKYNKLLDELTGLTKANAEYRKALDLIEQRLREAKLYCQEWRDTAKCWMKKYSSVQKIGTQLGLILADIDKIPSDPEDVVLSVSRATDEPLPDTEEYVQKTDQCQNPIPSSSQTTEIPDEVHETVGGQQSLQHMPSKAVEEDIPIVVKSRCLKRKRNSAPDGLLQAREKQPDQEYVPAKVIKQETPSSPITQMQRSNLVTQDCTIDLDELGERLKTPRKILLNSLSNMEKNASQGPPRNFNPGLVSGVATSRTVDALSVWPISRTASRRATENNPLNTCGGVVLKHQAPFMTSKKNTISMQVIDHGKPARKILRQLSPNVFSVSPRKDVSGHNSIAGEHADDTKKDLPRMRDESALIQRNLSDQNTKLDKPKTCKGLAALLEIAPQGRIILEPELTSTSQNVNTTSSLPKKQITLQEHTPKTEPGPSSSSASNGRKGGKASQKRRSERLSKITNTTGSRPKSPSKASSQEQCNGLRTKPFEHLKLDDFKVNPKYNQGHDHAFSEVVRGRNARNCLAGCTKWDCCGRTFQKVIEVGGIPELMTKQQGLWDEIQQGHEEEKAISEETRLLRWYLGEETKIDSLSKEERDKILLSARTKLFVDKHGKHRHAFERPSTPPGFWRTDMPSTQELEGDRGDAKKTEMEKKQERFREAMKSGGKWLFRDEC